MKMGAAGERALERLAVDETDGLYNLALRLTGNAVEAEDLVLDACRRMSAQLSKDRGESCTRPWLYRVLWETFVARNDQPSANSSGVAAGNGDPGPDRKKSVREDAFDVALMSLPCDYRAAVVLCWGEDFSYEEISWIMDRPHETVVSQIRRVFYDLRASFLLGPTAMTATTSRAPLPRASEVPRRS